jgi:8-oxo-dGTP diphosphatase
MGKADQGVAASRDRYPVIPRTLCFIMDGQDVLLLHGAPDKRIWPDLYNGVGGHLERDEDVWTAAVREMQEETGLEVRDVRLCGVINVDAGEGQAGVLIFVFAAQATGRETKPSAEGSLEWVPLDCVMGLDLVEDLPSILPYVLGQTAAKAPFFAHSSYDEDDELVMVFASRCPPNSED